MSKIFDDAKVSWLIERWQQNPERRDTYLPEIITESRKLMDMLIGKVLNAGIMDEEDWRSELTLKLIQILPKYSAKQGSVFNFFYRSFLNHIYTHIAKNNRQIHPISIEDLETQTWN